MTPVDATERRSPSSPEGATTPGEPVDPREPTATSPLAGAVSHARLAWTLFRLRPFDTSTALGRSNERYRRIALTAVSSLAVRGLGALVGLATVPIVLRYLGKERFGLWSTITTVVAWVALFDFGIANGLVNLVSRAHGRDDEAEAGRSVSTAFAILVAIAAVLAIGVAIAGPMVPWGSVLAVRGAVDAATVRWSVVAALAIFVVGMPLSIVPQIYAGYQRSYVSNALSLVGIAAGFVALVLAVRSQATMPWIVVTFGVGALLASAAGLVYAFVRFQWVRPRLSLVSRGAARELLARSVPLFLFQIGALAVNETQTIILAHRCDLAVVADYSVVIRLYLVVMAVVQVTTSSFLPTFREAHERGDARWMRAAFRQFLRVRMGLAILSGTALAFGGNALLRFWLRRNDVAFAPAVWLTVFVMVVAVTWASAHSDLLSIMDRLWVLVALVLVNGAVTVAVTYVLAPGLGVLGVLLATAGVPAGVYSWALPWLARRLVLAPDLAGPSERDRAA